MDVEIPQGLRVLAVDDEPTCLKILQRILQSCNYDVTITNDPIIALQMLKDNNGKFDILITDVHMPKMDGLDLLQRVTDIPVILVSANDNTNLVMKGVEYGAADYLLKPVRPQELKSIWKHVVKRKQIEIEKGKLVVGSCSKATPDPNETTMPDGSKKRKDQIEGGEGTKKGATKGKQEADDNKKPRVVWTPELHSKFAVVVDYLGPDRAYPKKILDLMNVDGLTRANVASHLQKYRLYLKRMNAAPGHVANGFYVPFGFHESIYMDKNFSTLCSLNDGGEGSSSIAIPPPLLPPPPYYGTSFGGPLGQFTMPTPRGPGLSIGRSMPQHQTLSNMYRPPMNNNNNNNIRNNHVFANRTPIGVPPNNVIRSQVVAPLSEYARRLESWSKQPVQPHIPRKQGPMYTSNNTMPPPPPPTNLTTNNNYSIDVPYVPNAYGNSFANASNTAMGSGLDPSMNHMQALDSPSIFGTMEPQGWNQNMNEANDIFAELNNIEPPYFFGGSSSGPGQLGEVGASSSSQFGQVGVGDSSQFGQMGASTSGPMQTAEDFSVDEVDMLDHTNFYLEESEYLASWTDGLDEFVGGFQTDN